LLLSLLSALLLILAFPEPGISAFGWVAFIPLFIVIMTSGFGRSLLAALVTGVIFYTVYLFWMKEYKHPLALTGGVFGVTVFWSAAAIIAHFLYHRIPRRGTPWRGLPLLGLVCGWFLIDYVKTIGFLAFPWGILGYSQYRNLLLIQSASIFGVWGIDLLILLCNAALAGVILDFLIPVPRRAAGGNSGIPLARRLIYPAAVLFFVALSLAWGVAKGREEKNRGFPQKRIAMVQANFDPWSPRLAENIATEIDLTLEALEHEPELVVWSESSVPFPYEAYLQRENPHAMRVHRFARALNRPFVFGTLEYTRDIATGQQRYYNVAVYYDAGILQGTYRKMRLVPFGEWFPYKRLFPFVVKILEAAGAGDFTPGEQYTIFSDSDIRFSVLICFEDVFGNLARQFVRRGSQVLINVTNDAWTGSEKAEIQHFSLSVFRAIENRRSLVRAANGGVTVCVNPYGRTTAQLDLFTSDMLVCDVDIVQSSEMTFYTRYGELLPLILVPLTLLAGLILLVRMLFASP
jgi:apolipoprotein N-acyltransferase